MVVALLLLARSPRVHADDDGNLVPGIAALVIYGGATLGFTFGDVAGDQSASYGFLEAAIHVPAAVVWASAGSGAHNDQDKAAAFFFAAWSTALAAHGVYEIARCRRPSPVSQPAGAIHVGPAHAVLGPVPMRGGGGLAISGSF
jgi:hypothetical protein